MEIGSLNSYSPSIQPVDPKATEKPVMNAPKETEADAKKMFQLAVQMEQTKGNKVDLQA